MDEAQVKALQEKLAKMSPEELQAFWKQQCIFCQLIDGKIPSKKVYEDNICIAIADINPATPGHLLLLPKLHYSVGPQVPEETIRHMGKVAKLLSHSCLQILGCKGTSIFMANGGAAGQQAQHFMIHIIPRYKNDDVPELKINKHSTNPEEIDKIEGPLREYISKKLNIKISQELPKQEVAQKTEQPKVEEKEPKAVPQEPVKEPPKKVVEETIETKLKREKGYLYFLDKDLNIKRVNAQEARERKKRNKKAPQEEVKENKDVKVKKVVEDKPANLDSIGRLFK